MKLSKSDLENLLILILYANASTNKITISKTTTTITYFHSSELTKLFTKRFKLKFVIIFIIIE